MTRAVSGLLQTTRVPTALLMGATVFLPALFTGVAPLAALLRAVPFVLGALGGFALNDYHDASKDRVNNPHRAIPRGALSESGVLAAALVLLVAALLAGVYEARGRADLLLYAVFILGMWSYNVVVRRLAASKTVYTAVVSSTLVWFDVVVLGYRPLYYLFPIAVVLFIVGRELLMDIRDMRGDRLGGAVTVPMILGPGATARLAFALQLAGASLLLPVAVTVSLPWNGLLLALVLASIGGAMLAWWRDAERYQRYVIHGLWIPMLAGIVMLLLRDR